MPTMNTIASAPDIHFSAHGIKKQLENIQPDKATGPGMIPAKVLKPTASELAPVLTPIFFNSHTIRERYRRPGSALTLHEYTRVAPELTRRTIVCMLVLILPTPEGWKAE